MNTRLLLTALGWVAVLERHGSMFFSEVGKKGSKALKVRTNPDYYSRIGKLGDAARQRARRKDIASPPER